MWAVLSEEAADALIASFNVFVVFQMKTWCFLKPTSMNTVSQQDDEHWIQRTRKIDGDYDHFTVWVFLASFRTLRVSPSSKMAALKVAVRSARSRGAAPSLWVSLLRGDKPPLCDLTCWSLIMTKLLDEHRWNWTECSHTRPADSADLHTLTSNSWSL